ncbi:hypothetical protein SAMN05216483_0170 [Streptomyces sp. 2131.1]|nr:hypothetical protein SAMN05216483_0170 [Streptomyces sp. 2131.1]
MRELGRFGRRGEHQPRAPLNDHVHDPASGPFGVHRQQGGSCRGAEPAELGIDVSAELGLPVRSGPHRTREDGGDTDARRRRLGVQPFGEGRDRSLGARVGQQVRNAEQTADRPDEAEAAPGLLQVRQRFQRGVQSAVEHRVHGVAQFRCAYVLDRRDLDDAGVGDDKVEAVTLMDLMHQGTHSGDRTDTGPSGLPQLRSCPLQFVSIAGGDGHNAPALRQLPGHKQPQAPGAAGDQGSWAPGSMRAGGARGHLIALLTGVLDAFGHCRETGRAPSAHASPHVTPRSATPRGCWAERPGCGSAIPA